MNSGSRTEKRKQKRKRAGSKITSLTVTVPNHTKLNLKDYLF